jgi:hypothetical protein
MGDMVNDFTLALNEEREHLALVQTWYEEAIGLSNGDVEMEPESGSTRTGPAATP